MREIDRFEELFYSFNEKKRSLAIQIATVNPDLNTQYQPKT